MRGAFARSSSAASGFFFCGIRLEPDEKSSAGSQKPNSWLDHRTSSDPSRERLATASIEFGDGVSNPRRFAVARRSSSNPEPASAPDPKGISPAPSRAAAKRAASRFSIQK